MNDQPHSGRRIRPSGTGMPFSTEEVVTKKDVDLSVEVMSPRVRFKHWDEIVQSFRSMFTVFVRQQNVSPEDLKGTKQFVELVGELVTRHPKFNLRPTDVPDLVSALEEWYFGGLGVMTRYVEQPGLQEISYNPDGKMFMTINGKTRRVKNPFNSTQEVLDFLQRVFAMQDKNINESNPSQDGSLPNGMRLHANIPPQSVDGPCFSIRAFRAIPFTMEEYVANGFCTPEFVASLKQWIGNSYNIMVVGGTGSGKTTALNAFGALLPNDDRLIVIEDTHELRIEVDNIVYLQSTGTDSAGSERGQEQGRTIRDSIRDALRMFPDRIIVGEVRGHEAFDMLQALNTGHDGSFGTFHANTAREALSRLESMAAASREPIENIQELIAWSIDIIIVVGKDKTADGLHRHVQEVWQFFHKSQVVKEDRDRLRQLEADQIVEYKGVVGGLELFKGQVDDNGKFELVKQNDPLRLSGKG